MKTTVVPAQITNVEDKVTANLSFTQLLLLVVPIFFSGAIFTLVPPMMDLTTLKLIACVVLGLIFSTLAVRVKGRLVIHWLVIIGRYQLRPRYYVADKNDLASRTGYHSSEPEPVSIPAVENRTVFEPLLQPSLELVRLESIVANPKANFELMVKKGALHVGIHEVKEESF